MICEALRKPLPGVGSTPMRRRGASTNVPEISKNGDRAGLREQIGLNDERGTRLTEIPRHGDSHDVAPFHSSASPRSERAGIQKAIKVPIGGVGRGNEQRLASAFLRKAGLAGIRHPDLQRP